MRSDCNIDVCTETCGDSRHRLSVERSSTLLTFQNRLQFRE